MSEYRLTVDGRDVSTVVVATSFPARLRGLLFTPPSAPPLLLTPGNSVHGWGMRYALDIAQLEGSVEGNLAVARVTRLRRWGWVPPKRGVTHVLEAPAGSFSRWHLKTGSHLTVQEH